MKCLTCNENFIGRRNQKYCSTLCKSEANNEIARGRQHDFRILIRKFHLNQRIVIHNKLIEKERVSVDLLIKCGFDFSYFIMIKHNDYSTQLYMISDSIFYTKINNDYVQFGKL